MSEEKKLESEPTVIEEKTTRKKKKTPAKKKTAPPKKRKPRAKKPYAFTLRRKLYHDILSSPLDDFDRIVSSVKTNDIMFLGNPLRAAQYIETSPDFKVLKQMENAYKRINKTRQTIRKPEHKYYKDAYMREMAAQMMGYNPSPMWGQLTSKKKYAEDNKDYLEIMRHGMHSTDMLPKRTTDQLMAELNRLKDSLRQNNLFRMDVLNDSDDDDNMETKQKM